MQLGFTTDPIKLWVVIVMNIFVYDILTKIKILFGADCLAIEREAFLSLYFLLVGFIALKLLDRWFINCLLYTSDAADE